MHFPDFSRLIRRRQINAAGLLFALLMGCSNLLHADPGRLVIKGSTTILPIATSIGEVFRQKYPDLEIQASGGGSVAGINALIAGDADIAISSTFITDEEIQQALQQGVYPVPFRIANDCIMPIVNIRNPVTNLSREDLKRIYLGQVDNWKQLGGHDLPIKVVSRDVASGTYQVWSHIVMNGAGVATNLPLKHSSVEVVKAVVNNRGAIGYIGLGYLGSQVKPLRVDGIMGSSRSLRDGTYLISRPLFMFTNGWPSGKTLEYIDFVLDPDRGQAMIEAADYIPIN